MQIIPYETTTSPFRKFQIQRAFSGVVFFGFSEVKNHKNGQGIPGKISSNALKLICHYCLSGFEGVRWTFGGDLSSRFYLVKSIAHEDRAMEFSSKNCMGGS
ncbi:hypothetical protein NC651_030828 [Populus alba x Populus x berolinensis]|nr:hypothetical protein NC651_030828 [Populus alba x Populus x berolinensis]